MIAIGSLIGSIIGFKFGGFFGMLFGAFIGMKAEMWVSESLLGRPSQKTRIQQAYFEALFTTAGKIAKADGVVSQSEVHRCELIMQRMQLDKTQRKRAIHLFNQGKQTGFNISPVLQNFVKTSGRAFSIKQMFLEMLLEIATAENKMSQAEWQVLAEVCNHLRFPQQLLLGLLRMRGFEVGGASQQYGQQQRQQKWTPPQQNTVDSYRILGIKASDTKAIIRRAYKKLMSQHHPDKLIAKGLPPEMIEIAKSKTQDIQAAWEDIKTRRGF